MSKSDAKPLEHLIRDDNHVAVQAISAFSVSDAGSPGITSPQAYSSTVITVVVPDRAVEFIVNPSTDLRISDSVGMTNYDVIAGDTKESIPCARMQNIYIKRDTADGTLNFRFHLI